jgi:hypothetical protein
MLRRDFACLVLKLPRRVGKNGCEALPLERAQQIFSGF